MVTHASLKSYEERTLNTG
uniref:Uncharacterized protein n=1 Tax=Anguilla anguilla TaxID=7936 RepID=A0A0E9X9R5_ANGAN